MTAGDGIWNGRKHIPFMVLVYLIFGVFSGKSYLYTVKRLYHDRRDFKT